MMNRVLLLLIIVCTAGLMACGDNASESTKTSPEEEAKRFASTAIEASFDEVMAIHDEVMPFIPQMKRDKKKLEEYQDQLNAAGDGGAEKLAQTEMAIQLLTQGDSLMFDWMKRFKSPTKTTSEAEALPYLAKEKVKVKVVSETMKKAMTEAQTILDQVVEQ